MSQSPGYRLGRRGDPPGSSRGRGRGPTTAPMPLQHHARRGHRCVSTGTPLGRSTPRGTAAPPPGLPEPPPEARRAPPTAAGRGDGRRRVSRQAPALRPLRRPRRSRTTPARKPAQGRGAPSGARGPLAGAPGVVRGGGRAGLPGARVRPRWGTARTPGPFGKASPWLAALGRTCKALRACCAAWWATGGRTGPDAVPPAAVAAGARRRVQSAGGPPAGAGGRVPGCKRGARGAGLGRWEYHTAQAT